jgi:hypothetical protein
MNRRQRWFLGLAVCGLAACGHRDQAGVAEPTGGCGTGAVVTPGCITVVVAPASVVLTPGQTARFTAMSVGEIVQPDGWKWSSTDSLRATVDSTGLARAMAAVPGVAICATVKSNPNKKACAQLVVQAGQ